VLITRTPLRISIGGGGTDLPSYYRQYGGFLIAAAIDKSVYVCVHRTFVAELVVRYSKIERVAQASKVKHPIVREALTLLSITEPNVEITSMADIPAGTGLGSSGSFGTALLKALYRYRNKVIAPGDLAEAACHIEIDRLGEPVGKQDQYVAAFGGLNVYEFRPGLPFEQFVTVFVRPLEVAEMHRSVGQFEQLEQSRCTTAAGGCRYVVNHRISQISASPLVKRKAGRQPKRTVIQGIASGATSAPILVPLLNIPVASARSFCGNQSATVRRAAGKLADSPRPSASLRSPRRSPRGCDRR